MQRLHRFSSIYMRAAIAGSRRGRGRARGERALAGIPYYTRRGFYRGGFRTFKKFSVPGGGVRTFKKFSVPGGGGPHFSKNFLCPGGGGGPHFSKNFPSRGGGGVRDFGLTKKLIKFFGKFYRPLFSGGYH